MLTQKHFQKMSNAVSYVRKLGTPDQPVREETLRVIARELAAICAEDNPRFDREKFLRACGF